MSKKQIDIYQRALHREKESRKQAERILENKSLELYKLSQELKKANYKLEHLLEKKTSELKGVFETIIDAYAIIDMQGNMIEMNDAAIKLFGYNFEEEKINVFQLINKEDYSEAIDSFKELTNKGKFINFQLRIICKNREIKWVNINASIIYDKDNNPIAAQGIIRDITNRKLIEQTIEEQRKQLSIIVDNSNMGIVLTQDGTIIMANNSIQNTLGYSESEMLELSIKDLTFLEDIKDSETNLKKINSGLIDNFEIKKRYKKKDGSIIWAKTKVNAVRDDLGDIKFQVALIEDVTAEREKTLMVETINNVARAIIGKVDIYEISWEITNNVTNYLGSDDCVIYLVNKDDNKLEQIAAYGEKLIDVRKINNRILLPIGKGIVGSVAKTGIAEIIKDTSKDSRYIVDDKVRFSEIAVPIVINDEVIGVIDSEHHDKNFYTESHLETLKYC